VQQKSDNPSCESCFWWFDETIRDAIGVVRCGVVGEWELGGVLADGVGVGFTGEGDRRANHNKYGV